MSTPIGVEQFSCVDLHHSAKLFMAGPPVASLRSVHHIIEVFEGLRRAWRGASNFGKREGTIVSLWVHELYGVCHCATPKISHEVLF
ncbi:hypothetical protein [Bifidobacterium oedipodis]|uniref:hypothetical protein n=1 Tax=Bifidobacterium oedipodis TaxID=2675322 RepID=UPI001F0F37E6|nr:hypothetical protein [Bifidobacterium sp. DSM 109957]